ncbi:MAG: peptidylprolyl isomerase [bacterium]
MIEQDKLNLKEEKQPDSDSLEPGQDKEEVQDENQEEKKPEPIKEYKEEEKVAQDVQEEKIEPVKECCRTDKEKETMRMFVYGFVGMIGLVAVVVSLVGVYRVYSKTATDNFTVTVAKVLRLPAFKLADQKVLYTEYVEDLNALKKLQEYDKTQGGLVGQYAELTDEEISEQALFRLIDNALVSKVAKVYNVQLAQDDVDTAKSAILQNFADTAAAEKEIKVRFGWDMDTYVRKVVHPYILKEKLNEEISKDDEVQKEIKEKAEKVLKEIIDGADLAEKIKQYDVDGTGRFAGDLGWFGKGAMVKPFEDAVFALNKGELNKELVKTDYGYHIVKLTDKKTEKVKDADGNETDQESVQATHILFPYLNINDYLDELVREVKVSFYLKVTNPLDEILNATSTTSTDE